MQFIQDGDIFKAETEAVVNTVNCVGIMGKGIALQFREKYPENYKSYKHACDNGKVVVGKMFVTKNGLLKPNYIINFPTKEHWRGKSKLEYIETGLDDLKLVLQKYNIKSVAIPPLGAGNGGLDWLTVKQLIIQKLNDLDTDIIIFEPSTRFNEVRHATKVDLNDFRATFIKCVNIYNSALDRMYELGNIEAQKLAYFIGLVLDRHDIINRYIKHIYGPYFPQLNNALRDMSGTYLSGFGDGQQQNHIDVMPGVIAEVDKYIAARPYLLHAIERIKKIIYGYETPFGMELLGTVHWVCTHNNIKSEQDIVKYVHSWNDRKKAIMSPDNILRAYRQLKNCHLVK
ncbi:MAG: macro domain-containing protein [Alphaproteobacteria bacterium]|nr:macro domain-containing protein [Alphaproteobacteria bacterium]